MTNTVAAGQRASTDHLVVSLSSLLTLNQCYISSHPKYVNVKFQPRRNFLCTF